MTATGSTQGGITPPQNLGLFSVSYREPLAGVTFGALSKLMTLYYQWAQEMGLLRITITNSTYKAALHKATHVSDSCLDDAKNDYTRMGESLASFGSYAATAKLNSDSLGEAANKVEPLESDNEKTLAMKKSLENRTSEISINDLGEERDLKMQEFLKEAQKNGYTFELDEEYTFKTQQGEVTYKVKDVISNLTEPETETLFDEVQETMRNREMKIQNLHQKAQTDIQNRQITTQLLISGANAISNGLQAGFTTDKATHEKKTVFADNALTVLEGVNKSIETDRDASIQASRDAMQNTHDAISKADLPR